MTTRRIVPAEATEEMLINGMIAKTTRAEEIDGPVAPLPTDRNPTIDEVGDYCTRTALRISSNIEIEAVWNDMLAASPASGKVSEAEVEKAAEALYRCDQDCLRKAASIGMKLVSGAITPWQNLHPENRDGYLIRARSAIAALGLEVE